MDERDVERVLREGLEAKADRADVTVPVVARARAEVGRRRRTRWSVGGAAAAVVLVVGGVAVATSGGDTPTEPPLSDPTSADAQPEEVSPWRTEYWQGVALAVPKEWGYGGAPSGSVPNAVACWPAAMVLPDGSRPAGREEDPELGWVGRPISLTDVCAGYPWIENSPQEEPTAPYAWLGAAVEPGIVEYANGYVEETIEVDGVTVTVATDDADLREEILGSARPGHMCESTLPDLPGARAGVAADRHGGLILAEVCAYRRDEPDGDYHLSYAADVAAVDAEAAFAAAERAPAAPPIDCAGDRFEFVVLHATYHDAFPNDVLDRTAVFDMFCGGSVNLGRGGFRALTADAVEPWANNGIPAVVTGPTGGKGAMIDSFIGMQG